MLGSGFPFQHPANGLPSVAQEMHREPLKSLRLWSRAKRTTDEFVTGEGRRAALMSALGGKRTFSAFKLSEFSLANDVGSPALDAALAVDDAKPKRVFEAVNFVDGTPIFVLFD